MVCFPKGSKNLEKKKNSLEFFDRENRRNLRMWRNRKKSSRKRERASGSGAGLRFPAVTLSC
jgi:hypothetical protein